MWSIFEGSLMGAAELLLKTFLLSRLAEVQQTLVVA